MCWTTPCAVRLNLMGQRNNFVGPPFRPHPEMGRRAELRLGLGTDTVWTLEYLHQQEDSIPDYGIPFLFGAPAPVNHRDAIRPALRRPLQNRCRNGDRQGHAQIRRCLLDQRTARYGSYWFDSRQTNPIYGSANCFTDTASPIILRAATLCAACRGSRPGNRANPLFPIGHAA